MGYYSANSYYLEEKNPANSKIQSLLAPNKHHQKRTEQRLTVSEHWTWFGTPSWATSKTPPPFGPPPFSSLSHSLPLSIWNTTAAAPNSSLENVFYSDDEEQGMDKDLHKKWIFRNRKKAFGWHRLKIWANSPAQQASTVCVCVCVGRGEEEERQEKRQTPSKAPGCFLAVPNVCSPRLGWQESSSRPLPDAWTRSPKKFPKTWWRRDDDVT